MLNNLLYKFLKPENPIDLDIYTKLPRDKYRLYERINIFFISILSLDKNFFFFFLIILRHIYIRILLFIFFPITILFKLLKFRFVVVNYWQLGTSLRHLTNLNKKIVLQKDNFKYFVYLPNNPNKSKYINKQFINNFTFIENIFLFFLLYVFFHSDLLRVKIMELDEHYETSISYYLQNLYKKNFYQKEFLNKKDKLELKNLFKKNFNFDLKDKIVTINVRNRNFYNTSKSFRDSEILNYRKAVEYLLEKDYKIFHYGNSNNEKFKDIKNKKNYFFFNVKDKNFSLDIQLYLINISKFFICTNSGPYVFGSELNVPVLLTNLYPFHGIFSYNFHDIVLPKRINLKNKPVKFKKILNNSLCFGIPRNSNYKIIDNTEDDIYLGVLEIERKLNNNNFTISTFNTKVLDDHHINKYGKGNISSKFIKNHRKYFS